MKRAWAYVCASEYTSSRTLSHYCRKIYELGYLPVCPRLQDGQYLVLDSPEERSDYAEIVRDKISRCPMLVVCGKDTDISMNAEIGLAQKYGRICTTMQGLTKAVESGDDLVS